MPKTLLLADDSVTIQKVVGISFASEDVELVTVDNGDDAIARAREIRPDLVLADVVMPGKNGYEVCEAINADPDLRHIPVLLLTGTFEAFDEQRASAAGAAGQVAKPFEAQTLVDQVKALLASPPAAAPLAPPIDLGGAAPVAMPTPLPSTPTLDPDNSFDFFDAAPAAALGSQAPPAAPPPDADATVVDDIGALDVGNDEFSFGDDSFEILTSDVGQPGAGATAPPSNGPPMTPDPIANDPAFDGAGLSPVAEPGPDPLLADLALDPVAPVGEADLDPGDLTQFSPELLEPQFTAEHEAPGAVAPALPHPVAGAEPAATQLFEVGGAFEPDVTPDLDVAGPAGHLADAAVLDPNGASGYDVSSSDLGPPVALEPEPPMADLASDDPPGIDFGASADTGDGFDVIDAASVAPAGHDLVPPPLPKPPPAPGAVGRSDVDFDLGQPMEPPTPVSAGGGSDFGPSLTSPPPVPVPAPVELAPAEPPPVPEPVVPAESYAPSALPAPSLGDTSPEAAVATHSTESTEDLAAAAVARAMPQLKAQIHDTLEKVAWESFGNLTEEIVKQALERVEAIAWEVVPRMAETLIQEEIRKLKGGGSDDSDSGI